ncbi:hypothetical protein ACROYT_G013977 [Oculina patagonica]
MLRDRLVCGINDKKIQRRLLAERELTLKKAEEIALGEELAAKYVVDIQSETTPAKYIREKIPVLGEVLIPVKYQNQQHDLPAMVVKGPGLNLLGRDWLQVIKFNWNSIFNIQEINPQLQKILDAHKNVFGEGLGTLKGTEAKIYVDPGATPKFMKARPVPYALKAKVEQELDRLQSEGIISPVEFTEWAAPIVPVVKQDGSVRIYGDYKCTVNQVSKLDNYPIPKTEDLLATLGGGNKFTKLDMSQAYQQLLLDEESRKFTTINTYKGLYQYNRLPFGVSSAPGIFQRTMENVLQGIPHVVVISGKNDTDHLANLEAVLSRLSNARLRLRLAKCLFVQPQVTYCGYVINGDGIEPVAAKVGAIKNAPEPFKGEMFFVVADAYSKWLEVHRMRSTTSTATVEKLREMFATHGLPATLVSDNGSNFTSSEFQEFMKKNGIKHIKVSPYHPASNGLAERAVQIFKEGYEKMEEGSVQTKLSRFLLSYRTTPHSTTGVSPAELLMRRKLHTQLNRLIPSVANKVRDKQSQQKTAHDYHAKEREVVEGQAVYTKDFRHKNT